jgi:hypothetical protein
MARVGAPVGRAGNGRVTLRLDGNERRIIATLTAELRAALEDPTAVGPDGSLARLFPPAFPDDPDAEAEYAGLVRADLVDGRREQLATVEATLEATDLDDTQAAAWLGVLNDLRLALGTSLGVDQDDDGAMPDADDPDAMRLAVFAYLGWLVGAFVDVLEDALPEVPGEVG